MPDTAPTICLLYTTWPDEESVTRAAHRLLEQGLIACANILGGSQSIYRWEGEVQSEREIIALFKTASASARQARAEISALHPYDEPCILALDVNSALSAESFQNWVIEQTS